MFKAQVKRHLMCSKRLNIFDQKYFWCLFLYFFLLTLYLPIFNLYVRLRKKSQIQRILWILSIDKFLFIGVRGPSDKFHYKYKDLKIKPILFSFCFIQLWLKTENRRQTDRLVNYQLTLKKIKPIWLVLGLNPWYWILLLWLLWCYINKGGKKKENKLSHQGQRIVQQKWGPSR